MLKVASGDIATVCFEIEELRVLTVIIICVYLEFFSVLHFPVLLDLVSPGDNDC